MLRPPDQIEGDRIVFDDHRRTVLLGVADDGIYSVALESAAGFHCCLRTFCALCSRDGLFGRLNGMKIFDQVLPHRFEIGQHFLEIAELFDHRLQRRAHPHRRNFRL